MVRCPSAWDMEGVINFTSISDHLKHGERLKVKFSQMLYRRPN